MALPSSANHAALRSGLGFPCEGGLGGVSAAGDAAEGDLEDLLIDGVGAAAALLAALLGTPTLAHAQEKSMPEQIADVLVQLSGGILGR
jgi:hypothetical protein